MTGGQAFSIEVFTNTVVEIDVVHGTSEQPQEASYKLVDGDRSAEMVLIDNTVFYSF